MKSYAFKILIKLSLFVIILLSCQKNNVEPLEEDNVDYLEKYKGSFTFTIKRHDQIWVDNIDTIYTTIIVGQISTYTGDLNNGYRRLSIDYGKIIEPEVLKTGDFVRQPDIHQQLDGKFLSADEVKFEFWQNSAGFSKKDIVTGKRTPGPH